jgi:predicted AlkP superfamily pyrophosphatase or phosphodiesterase
MTALISCILSTVALGEFYFTYQMDDSEYYILSFSIICGISGIISWWALFSKKYPHNPANV